MQGVSILQFPTGKFGYVGNVPARIYYADGATDEEIRAGERFGARFGPKRRIFDTRQEAVDFLTQATTGDQHDHNNR